MSLNLHEGMHCEVIQPAACEAALKTALSVLYVK
jgi:hypothetical protein